MWVGIEEKSGKRTPAIQAEKSSRNFYSCSGEELRLRKGTIRIHHFAHLRSTSCLYKGESLILPESQTLVNFGKHFLNDSVQALII